MIEVLVSGKLVGAPEQRNAKSGKAYVQCRMRVSAGADETLFIRATAFSDSACTALLALDDGDAVAMAGTLKVGVWTPQGGEPRANLDMVAAQVLTAYHLKRRREAMQPSGGGQDEAPATRQTPARKQTAARRTADRDLEDFGAAGDVGWLSGSAM